MNRYLAILGLILTFSYLAVVTWFFGWSLVSIRDLPPNSAGDFLTGVFGPIAIFWLILGFFQQGEELKQNTEALRLQAKELASSAAEQRALVAATRNQVEAQQENLALHKAQFEQSLFPRFLFTGLGSYSKADGAVHQVHLRNLGAIASSVRFEAQPAAAKVAPSDISVLMPGQEYSLEIRFDQGHPLATDRLGVHFLDSAGREGTTTFAFALNESGAFCNIVQYAG